MGTVTPITAARTDPHMSGAAICFKCKHEWMAVAPIGATELRCPACACDGYLMGTTVTEHPQWQCRCGCFLFRLDTFSTYCANCAWKIR